jgi:hypothetical protein
VNEDGHRKSNLLTEQQPRRTAFLRL